MKKLLVCLVAGFTLFSLRASADINVKWLNTGASEQILQADGTTPAPFGWLAQLIWLPSGAMPSVPNAGSPLDVGAGEVLLRESAVGGSAFDNGYMTPVPPDTPYVDATDALVGGYVYTRVFNVDFGSGATPTMYGTSQTDGALVKATNDPGTQLQHDPLNVIVGSAIVAIPEPSTYALFGFGALLMAFYRYRRK